MFLMSCVDGWDFSCVSDVLLTQLYFDCVPQFELVLDAAHIKSPEPSKGPRKEDIVESVIFKASNVVVATFKDVDLNFARKGTGLICIVRF